MCGLILTVTVLPPSEIDGRGGGDVGLELGSGVGRIRVEGARDRVDDGVVLGAVGLAGVEAFEVLVVVDGESAAAMLAVELLAGRRLAGLQRDHRGARAAARAAGSRVSASSPVPAKAASGPRHKAVARPIREPAASPVVLLPFNIV